MPVKRVLYNGFGHAVNKPKQQRAVMEENELWFGHYIWGDALPADLTPTVKAKKDDSSTAKQAGRNGPGRVCIWGACPVASVSAETGLPSRFGE